MADDPFLIVAIAPGALTELIPPPDRGRVFAQRFAPGLADVTPTGRARLDAIARWLQDIAYADLVDAGLAGQGAWVVRRLRLRIAGFPRFGEELTLRTFCSGVGTLVAERRTTVSGGSAEVEAAGLWVHLDPRSMRPARLGGGFLALYGESAGGRRTRSRLRHPPPPADATSAPWRFRAADLDIAGHVNNAAYWEIVEELLWEGEEPDSADLEIEFRDPAQPGEAVLLRAGGGLWVAGGSGALHASVLGLAASGS